MLAFRRLACRRRIFLHHFGRPLSETTSVAPPTGIHTRFASSADTAIPDATTTGATHYKITLRRSPISLGSRIKGTLTSLGIYRRMQTVYHPHSPVVAGKILAVKELVEVENVGSDAVLTKQEQRKTRRPPRGYRVVGKLLPQR